VIPGEDVNRFSNPFLKCGIDLKFLIVSTIFLFLGRSLLSSDSLQLGNGLLLTVEAGIDNLKFVSNILFRNRDKQVAMETIFDKAKGFVKTLRRMQAEMKENTPVEKLTFPESDEKPAPSDGIQTVDISTKSVARATITILAILALAYFLYEVRGLLILFFVSIFFASALDPFVDWLEKKHIPRPMGVIIILLLFFSVFVVIIGSAVPIIVKQATLIAASIAEYFRGLFGTLQSGKGLDFLPETVRTYVQSSIESVNLEWATAQILENFSNLAEQVRDLATGVGSTVGVVGAGVTSVTLSIAEFFFSMVLVFFLVFFMVVDKNNLHEFFQSLFPKRYGTYISTRIADIQKQMGAWLRGTFLMVLIMFGLTFIGLNLIGMGEYALTLALIMGVGELIPYIGPLIFLVFSLPIAFTISLIMVVKLIIFYVIIQGAEGNILLPAVMKRVVGLSPIIVIIVLLIGWQFLGIIGAVIAVPVTTAVAMFVRDYMKAIKNK
jgi:predicted PurR-regulated permease PerM